MAIITLPIAGGFYLSNSLPLAAQECTNWYPNIVQAQALSQETLFGTPGSEILTNGVGTREVNRGGRVLNGIPYFVNGTVLYRLERSISGSLQTFSVVALGTIEGTERVSMADNGRQLCILIPGGKGYIFTPDTLTEITDLDFRANGVPQHVVFLDGFFVFSTDTKKFIISALNDGLSYNALDFGTAESSPDDIVAPIVLNNQLFIGGTETLEAFQNIGGADFPFQRTGLFLQTGVAAAFTAIAVFNTFVFIGSSRNASPAIWELSGNTVNKISTTAIDTLLQTFTDDEIKTSFAWTYAQKGAHFVGFALPSTCLVYDFITQRWHERKSQLTDFVGNEDIVRSRINSVVEAYGRVIVGDSQDGRIGELSPDIYIEYGSNIIRRVATMPFQNNMQAFVVPSIELTVESGAGNDDVVDPQIRMDMSMDGKTWSDDRSRSIGRKGEFTRRAIWRRLGRVARFTIFRFTLSDPIKPVILQFTAQIVSGDG